MQGRPVARLHHNGRMNPPGRLPALLLLLAAAPAACGSPRVPAPPPDPLLEGAAHPYRAGHAALRDAWEDLPREERIGRLLAGLRSPDPAVALFAARALPPECLSLEELRLQCDLLAARPGDVLLCEGGRSLGSPDAPRLLEAAVKQGLEAEEESLRDLHRVMGPDHIPGLVALLEAAKRSTCRDLLWLLALLADNTDLHRDEVARGLLYARAAALAELEGRAPPRLADFAAARADGPTLDLLEAAAAPGGPLEAHAFRLPRAWIARCRGETESPERRGPEAFTPAAARERIAALRAAGPPAEEDGSRERFEEEAPLLEAAAPEETEALLAAWAAAGDEGAVELLRRLGAPRGWRLREEEGPSPPPEERLRRALEEDPSPGEVARLGLLGGPALPVLRRLRDERHRGLRWAATAGLAIAGDGAAREEFLALLADDRTFLYDPWWGDPVGLALNGDPAALAHWRSRVGSNCCLWGCAAAVLRAWYPTLPCEVRVGDFDGTAARAAAWWERWGHRLRWSRLADGWVPVEE